MTREEYSMRSSLADMAALGKLFEEHRPKLLAMVQRRLDSALAPRIDPEEILNEAFTTPGANGTTSRTSRR